MKKIIVLLFLMTFVIAMFPIKTKASTFVWKIPSYKGEPFWRNEE
jgi:hypothetical protein